MASRIVAVLVLLFSASGSPQGSADPIWRDALDLAAREKKPILVFFRPAKCAPCDEFERISVAHPTIVPRRNAVVFVTLPNAGEPAATAWRSADPGVALFDRSGTVRARWRVMPDTMRFGLMLDSAAAVASRLERAVALTEAGKEDEASLVVADALATIGFLPEARAALKGASESSEVAIQREAAVAAALLDAREGRRSDAVRELERIVAISDSDGAGRAASEALSNLREARTAAAIRILPLSQQVVKGRQTVRTHVTSAAVSRVLFFVDGRQVHSANRPPFSAGIEFGRVPVRQAIRVVAFDRAGREIARDERVVNGAGETFRVRIVEPREGAAESRVRVVLDVRVPPSRQISRVTITWNDAERAVLRAQPWEALIDIPQGQLGVLQSLAVLDDGRTSEDAVLLNAGGGVAHADVQLVELPITILGGAARMPAIQPSDITVREGSKQRVVESVSTADETPLTIGVVIDTSESMHKTLPDVQEAVAGFVSTVLGERDRAFVIRFDSQARLVEPASSDRERLRRRVMSLQPRGLTALYDATALALLQFEGVKGRRGIVLFTDGLDRTSEYTAAEVAELARRVHVPIHVIAALPGVAAGTPADEASMADAAEVDAVLRRVVESSGGTLQVLRDLSELPAMYSRIESALRSQVLAFVRTGRAQRENEWREVKVEVRGVDSSSVFAPAGYYAPW